MHRSADAVSRESTKKDHDQGRHLLPSKKLLQASSLSRGCRSKQRLSDSSSTRYWPAVCMAPDVHAPFLVLGLDPPPHGAHGVQRRSARGSVGLVQRQSLFYLPALPRRRADQEGGGGDKYRVVRLVPQIWIFFQGSRLDELLFSLLCLSCTSFDTGPKWRTTGLKRWTRATAVQVWPSQCLKVSACLSHRLTCDRWL